MMTHRRFPDLPPTLNPFGIRELAPLKSPLSMSSADFRLNQDFSTRPVDEEDESPISLASTSMKKKIYGSLPRFNIRRSIETMSFEDLCSDPTITINPHHLQFIPSTSWSNDSISFGLLLATFFRKRNSSNCTFPYKLYNALRLATCCPEFIPHTGIQWVTDNIIRVDRVIFARLIGVKTIEGSLFHQQGNFPSHGFEELSFQESNELSHNLGFGPADLSVVRFVRHEKGGFTRNSNEADLEKLKWVNRAPV